MASTPTSIDRTLIPPFPRRSSSSYVPPTPSPLSPFSTPPPVPSTPLPPLPTHSHYYRPPRSSLTSPTRSNISSPTGSPGRSSRQTRIQSLLASDELLSRLTPVTIARFANDSAFAFSPIERNWSIRAAEGIVKVGEWLREVEGWNLHWRVARGSGRDGGGGYLPPRKKRKVMEEVEGDGQMGSIEEVEEEADLEEEEEEEEEEEGGGGDLQVGSVRVVGRKTRRKLFVGGRGEEEDEEVMPSVVQENRKKPLTPYQLKIQKQKAATEGKTTPTQKSLPTPVQTPVLAKKTGAPGREEEEEEEEEESEEEEVDDGEEYWGSLPGSLVEKYEARIAFIKSEIEELDVEALKSKVLSYRTGITNPLTDSSAIITATTLQLLPPLHRLTKLLSLWTVRLAVLRIVPVFLRWLNIARNALEAGYAAIHHPSIFVSGLEEETFALLQDTITQKVATAGRLMDTMLDALEGREDVLPSVWIEDLEEVEERVGAWEMDGEKVVLEGRLRQQDLRTGREREMEKTALVLEQERSAREAEKVGAEIEGVMERAEQTERGLREAMEANEVVSEGIELDDGGVESPIEDASGWGEEELLVRLEGIERMRMRNGSLGSEVEDGEWADANEGTRGRWGTGHGLSLEPITAYQGRRGSAVSSSSTPFMTPMPTPWFTQEAQNGRGVGDVSSARVYPVMHPAAVQGHPATTQVHPAVGHSHAAAIARDHSAVVQRHPSVTQSHPAVTQNHPAVTQNHPAVTQSHPSVTQTHPAVTQTHPSTTKIHPSVIEPHPSVSRSQTRPSELSRNGTQTPPRVPTLPHTPSPEFQRERSTPPSPEIIKERPAVLAAARTFFTSELERESEEALAAQIEAEERERLKNIEDEIDRLAEQEAARFFEDCEKVAAAQAAEVVDDDEEDWIDEEEEGGGRNRAEYQKAVAAKEVTSAAEAAEAEAQRQEAIEEAQYRQRVVAEEAKWAAEPATKTEHYMEETESERKRRVSIERVSALEAARLSTEDDHQRLLAEEAAYVVEEVRQRQAEEREAVAEAQKQREAEEEERNELAKIAAAAAAAAAALAAATATAAGTHKERVAADAVSKRQEAERKKAEIKRIGAAEAARLVVEAEAEAERQGTIEAERLASLETARLKAEAEARADAERQRLIQEEAARVAAAEKARKVAEAEVERQRLIAEEAEKQRALEIKRLAALETARLKAEAEAAAETRRVEEERRKDAEAKARLAAEAHAKAIRLAETEVARQRKEELEKLAAIEAARVTEEKAKRKRMQDLEAERLRVINEEAERKRVEEIERLAAIECARVAAEEEKAERQRVEDQRIAEVERLTALTAAEEAERQRFLSEHNRIAEAAEAEAERQISAEFEARRIAAVKAKAESQRFAALKASEVEAHRLAAVEARAYAYEQSKLGQMEGDDALFAAALAEAERLEAEEEEAEHARLKAEAFALQRALEEEENDREEQEERERIMAVIIAAEAEAEEKRLQALEEEETRKRLAAQQAAWDAEDEEERRLVAAIQEAAEKAEADARQEALESEELHRRVAAQEAEWEAEEQEERRMVEAVRQASLVEEMEWAAQEEAEHRKIAELERQSEAEAKRKEALEEEEIRQMIAAREAAWAAEEREEEQEMLAAIQQSLAEAEEKEKEGCRFQAEAEAAAKAEEARSFEEIDRQRRLAEDERQRLADLALVEQEKKREAAQEAERLKAEREIEEARIKAELLREQEEKRRQESLLPVEKHTGSNSEGGSISGDDVTEEYHDISHVVKSLPPRKDEDFEEEMVGLWKSQNSRPSVPPPSVEMTPVTSRSPSLRDTWAFDNEGGLVAAENLAAHNSLQQAINDSAEYELPRAITSPDNSMSETSFNERPSILVAPSTPQKSLELDELNSTPRTAIWDHSANSPVFEEGDSFGDASFPSDMTIDEGNYQQDYGQEDDSSDFEIAPLATSTPKKPTRRLGRLSALDSITEVLTPRTPRDQYFTAADGKGPNDMYDTTPSKRGKGLDLMLPDAFSRDNEDSGGSGGEHSKNQQQWAPITLDIPPARSGSSMSNKSSMSNMSMKKRTIPETKPPIKTQRSQRFTRKAPLDMGRPRSLSAANDRPRPSSSASDYVTPPTKALPKVIPKGSLGPAMKAVRRQRKDIDSDDEEEPQWPRSKENTPDWASSPPTPSLGVTPRLTVVKKQARQPANFSSMVTPEKSKRQSLTPSEQGGPSRPPRLEFPPSSLDDKVNEILTALASPVRLTASNLQKLTETTNKRQPPLRPFELTTPSGIPAPKSIGSNPSVMSDATSYSRGGRRHVPSSPGDIKLYHLHRSDGQAPIKLYIRLVGEKGERVMVRVGGGWADLAEYLKEYATHHGSKRRVVSEGRIEIQDMAGTTHHHALHPSRSISSLRSASPSPGSRSNSPLPGGRSRAGSTASRRPESPLNTARRGESPSPRSVMRGGHNGTVKDLISPNLTAFQPLTYQRQSGLSPPTNPKPPSRPGSSHSAVGGIRRSASRLSFTESAFDSGEMGHLIDQGPPKPLGLAGPKGKNNEISPENQAWVEGMLGEVRKVSAHRRRRLTGGSNNGDMMPDIIPGEMVELQPGVQFGGRLGISDMGKQGATRRVFPKKG